MGFRVQISILHFVRQTSQLDNLSSGIPNLVVQNDRISNYRLSILVAMPCPYCMCTVFYVKQSVAKACFSVCWIIWLRFCKPVKKDTKIYVLYMSLVYPHSYIAVVLCISKWHDTNGCNLEALFPDSDASFRQMRKQLALKKKIAYVDDGPSLFPPSPITM